MSTAAFRTTLATTFALLALAGSITFAEAKPNDGRFKMSAEAMRRGLAQDCNAAFNFLDEAQDQAEDLAEDGDIAGSTAASESADSWWAYGERKGCSWAQ